MSFLRARKIINGVGGRRVKHAIEATDNHAGAKKEMKEKPLSGV